MAKYTSTTPENKCVFCEIVKGNIQTPGVFREDEEHMAFLSIFPNTEGNTVVITKDHHWSDVLAMKGERLAKFVLAAKKVQEILLKTFDEAGRVWLVMEGTGIDHAHIKLYPMHNTKHMKEGTRKQYVSNNETYFKEYIGYISSNDGPRGDDEAIKKLAEKLKNNI